MRIDLENSLALWSQHQFLVDIPRIEGGLIQELQLGPRNLLDFMKKLGMIAYVLHSELTSLLFDGLLLRKAPSLESPPHKLLVNVKSKLCQRTASSEHVTELPAALISEVKVPRIPLVAVV